MPFYVNGATGTGNPVMDAIVSVANSLALPPAIPLSIAGWETRGRYNADSLNQSDWNGYASVGIFQINTAPGNPGDGYSVAQLEDPYTNSMIAEQRMLAPYQRGVAQGLSGTALLDYVANNSGWPLTAGVDAANRAEPSYDQGLNQFYLSHFGNGKDVVPQLPAPFSVSDSITKGTAGTFQALDSHMEFKGFDVTHPVSYITNNAEAMAFRLLLFLVGLLLIIFALVAAVKKEMG